MSQHQGGWAREAHNTDDSVKFSSCPTLILRRTWFLKKCQCGWLSPNDLMSRCRRRRGGGTLIPATISARGTRATKNHKKYTYIFPYVYIHIYTAHALLEAQHQHLGWVRRLWYMLKGACCRGTTSASQAEGPGSNPSASTLPPRKKVGTSFAPGHQAKMSLNVEDTVPLKKLTLDSYRE